MQVWVGGGGEHTLCLKNIQLHYIVFEDTEQSVVLTHRKLMCEDTATGTDAPPSDISTLLHLCRVAREGPSIRYECSKYQRRGHGAHCISIQS